MTAHVRCGQAAAQASSRSACATQARTLTWPSALSAWSITTAVCDPLCGSTPIITTATTCPFLTFTPDGTAAGMPYYRSVIVAPLTSHATARSGRPARRSKARPSPAGSGSESQAYRTSERYDLRRNA